MSNPEKPFIKNNESNNKTKERKYINNSPKFHNEIVGLLEDNNKYAKNLQKFSIEFSKKSKNLNIEYIWLLKDYFRELKRLSAWVSLITLLLEDYTYDMDVSKLLETFELLLIDINFDEYFKEKDKKIIDNWFKKLDLLNNKINSLLKNNEWLLNNHLDNHSKEYIDISIKNLQFHIQENNEYKEKVGYYEKIIFIRKSIDSVRSNYEWYKELIQENKFIYNMYFSKQNKADILEVFTIFEGLEKDFNHMNNIVLDFSLEEKYFLKVNNLMEEYIKFLDILHNKINNNIS